MYPMDPERRSHQREYEEPETCSHQREYGEPERCSQRREYEEPETCSQRREYGEPETCSQRKEYGEPETCSQQREYGEPERCSQRREYEEPETCSQRREYGEPETCSQWREYGEPERCSQRREYGEPERCSQRREYEEPETCSQRREYREPSSGQWDDGLETRGNGQAMARELYSEYSSMRRTREDWEDYGASSDMSYTMDPSSRDWSEGSLRGSGVPFSPDTDGEVDGDPVELSVDLELLRNRMELEIIEEQIALKKAVLAMELVGPESKAICKQKTKDKDLEVLTTNVSNNDVTLKERVNCILRRRAWTNECRSKEAANQKVPPKLVLHPPKLVKSFVERMNESILHKDSRLKGSLTLDVHEEEHPLKLKVEALLAQRQNPTVNKEDKAAKGFQHFLNVLNKGVDIDRLSKIVNNFKDLPSMGEELPQGQPPPLHGQPETNSKSERKVPSRKRRSRFDEFPQGSFDILWGQPTLLGVQPNPFGDLLGQVAQAGNILPQHCSLLQSGGGEIGQHSLSLGFIQAMDSPKNKKPKSTQVAEKRKGRLKSKSPPVEQKGKGRHKSKSPPVEQKGKGRLKSKSPPVEEKRKGRLKSKSPPVEENREGRLKSMSPQVEEKRKLRPDDEQKYGQIQSLLQTVGLDLGVEELGRLNDRIQERLYGKKRDLGKKGGKNESVWEVEKEESKKDKEESKKYKEESEKDKEESEKDKQKEKEESEKDKQKEKEESEKDKQKEKEESEKDKQKEKEESEKDKQEEKEESEKDKQKEKEESEKDKQKEKEESEKDKQKEKEESEKDKQEEKEESEKGKDKEESACSSKCHSITLLSDSSNSSPPCHRWTAKYKRSSTRDQDRERDRDRGRSERDRRSSTRDQDRERDRDRCSSTRDQDRERDRDRGRSERDRRSSTRDQDRERDRDRRSSTRDQDRERYRDRGRSERDRGRSERDRGRSERDRGRSERDRGRSERDRDRRSSTRDQDRERDGGRSERDRHSSTRELDRYRWLETERKIRSSTRDGDREWDRSRSERDRLSSTRDRSEKDGDGDRSERDEDRERWWERDKEWDGDKESFRGLYPYSNDPTHPRASLMATDPVQYSQYMAYHGSPYASAFPPGCSFPPGTVFPSTMPPSNVLHGTVPPPNPLGYPLYPNCPPSYYSGPSERFFQPYTQATGNPQFTNMDVQMQDPDASLSIPEQTVWPRLVHPSINQDSKPAGLNRLSIKMQLKRQRYWNNLINRKNMQELRQLKETPLVAAKEPGTKKVPEGDAVIKGEKLHFVVPPVATTYSGAPSRTGFPNRKGRKGKTLEEKGGLFNQGLSMRNRAYMTRWKLRLAEAVAKGLEVSSEPEPKTVPEAKDKSLTEWQRLFADSVANVAATDLSALSEPESEKKPDWETEQKRTDEEMKVKLKKKLGEFNLKMKQKAPSEAPT
ncbi:WD repeat-containing protein 87-like [Oncorhynchus masou masou]|uniref:WD repeat-containing protein 87-like n=1 Tax=Oncorhynchus masou masou TaxID=90313 RepID=UPI00318309E6